LLLELLPLGIGRLAILGLGSDRPAVIETGSVGPDEFFIEETLIDSLDARIPLPPAEAKLARGADLAFDNGSFLQPCSLSQRES
jgi:hypothetical protein